MKHIVHVKFPPSSDVWLCVHGVGYPNLYGLCEESINSTDDKIDQKQTEKENNASTV